MSYCITKNFLCIIHTVEHNYISPSSTTTCFGPMCGPSSCCDLTYRTAIQDMWGVLLGPTLRAETCGCIHTALLGEI